MSAEGQVSRMAEARSTARDLIRSLEDENLPINQVLMKAHKLARLLRDTDAQTWLSYETHGYPALRSEVALGSCSPYAYRFLPDGKMVQASLQEFEAMAKAAEVVLAKLQSANISTPASDFLAAGATKAVIAAMNAELGAARDSFVNASTNYHRMRNGIHRFAVDKLIAIELGDAAESVFASARERVDVFVSTHVPKGAEQLVAASERLRDGNSEGCSAALTACRRFLVSLADALFPPRTEPYDNGRGKPRKVGPEEYKNRLLAYAETRITSATHASLVTSQLEHVVARLEALNDLVCKGVHAEVGVAEARLALIDTYIFAAELIRIGS